MNWTKLSLKTLIPQIPKIVNDNFDKFKAYMDVFYNEETGVFIKPLNITGRVKAGTGEFVNVITDNMTVKKQFTNMYDNMTSIDLDFVKTYNGDITPYRNATSLDPSMNQVPLEPSTYVWIDIQTPYIKIINDVSYGFQNNKIGQEVDLIFEPSTGVTTPFKVLLKQDETGVINELEIDSLDYDKTWVKLITIGYDVSYGPEWIIKEYSSK